MTDYTIINRSYPQVDALEKVTGRRTYISDIRISGMLWGKVLRSSRPHARIKEIDISRALRIPGVEAVLTPGDTPRIPCGPFLSDWEILPHDKVRYVGQPVLAVAAKHEDAAEEAVRAVRVSYEDLPTVFDPKEAMASGAPLVHEEKGSNIAASFTLEKGDVERAFEGSDYIREGTFSPSTQFHAALEPNGAIATYDPVSGNFTLWAVTQTPYPAWLLYAKALGIEQKRLRLLQAPMGGAFGSKFESNLHLIALCLSKKSEKPVRLVNTFQEEFVTAPLRVPMEVFLKIGIKKDGKITAKEVEVIADNGAFTYWGPAVLSTACYRVDNLYRILNSRSKGYLVYTNNLPKGACRGFGQPQMLFCFEGLLDELAQDAAMDPGDLRIVNAFKSGETTIHGWFIGSCGLPECIRQAKERSRWREKRREYADQKGRRRRGIGLACCNHVSGNRACLKEFDGSTAMVRVGSEGKALVLTGEIDVGQGYSTVAAQCAAEELGLPLSMVEVAPVDSQSSLIGIGSFASRATLMGCNAVRSAAAEVREKILKAAADALGKSPELLMLKEGVLCEKGGAQLGCFEEVIQRLVYAQAGQPFVGVGRYVPDVALADPKTKFGNPSPAYPFAAHVAEVEVDTETGRVEVVNYIAANDVGKAINPLLVKGQLEGGAVQGMGYALTEDLIIHEGEIVYKTLLDYKIPTIADMPSIDPVIVEEEDPNGPYGAKSVGEAALDPVAAAISNAIYNAVGIRVRRLPVRPEWLLEALRSKSGDAQVQRDAGEGM
jgi:CO/xanthine dehydrogenase Mo-binding subunit